MFEIAKEKSLVNNRDQMRTLPYNIQRELQDLTAEKITAINDDVCVDTHCTIKTAKGYLPGLPQAILEKIKPQIIILVEASPEEIMQRRARDTRDRDVDTKEQIEEHQLMNRIAAMGYATLIGSTVKIIQNHENKLEDAAQDIIDILHSSGGQ
jgi:adenylate kinase